MTVINSNTRAAWQDIANELSKNRPSVGRRVTVTGGRKHKGRVGEVIRHEVSRFYDPFRYASEAQAHMREMEGRNGFVVLIRTDEGETFWCNANHVDVHQMVRGVVCDPEPRIVHRDEQ